MINGTACEDVSSHYLARVSVLIAQVLYTGYQISGLNGVPGLPQLLTVMHWTGRINSVHSIVGCAVVCAAAERPRGQLKLTSVVYNLKLMHVSHRVAH